MRIRRLVSVACAVLMAAPVGAMEVTPPVSFEPIVGAAGYTLRVNEGSLTIDGGIREIFLDGRLVALEGIRLPEAIVGQPIKLDGKTQEEGIAVAQIGLDAETFPRLEDGVYAQKLRIVAHWEDQRGEKFSVYQWTYVQIAQGKARGITAAEYSKAVDLVERAIDPLGRLTDVFVGRAADVVAPPVGDPKSEALRVQSDEEKLELEHLRTRPVERDER
jgi:hypothetical protein